MRNLSDKWSCGIERLPNCFLNFKNFFLNLYGMIKRFNGPRLMARKMVHFTAKCITQKSKISRR